MNIGIQIGDEFLDLPPDTVLEMEEENPFLQFRDEQKGDTTLPFEILLSAKNMRLTNFAGLPQTRPNIKGIDALIWDRGLQHSICKIKLEKSAHNLNRAKDGALSVYALGSWSSFYQEIKGIKLREIDVGGKRRIDFNGFDRTAGGGFWQHIHQVVDAAPGSFDYAFYPVINKGWEAPFVSTELMNRMELVGGQPTFSRYSTDGKWVNPIVPFPYLKYVLERAAAHAGWTVEGDILNDPEFQKITMLNFVSLNWGIGVKALQHWIIAAFPFVEFNLQDNLPDISLVEFFLWLRNRFAWAYDFDRYRKVIRIRPFKQAAISAVKDYTYAASPLLPKTIAQEQKNYALRNDFRSDYGDGAPTFVLEDDGTRRPSAVTYQGTIATKAALPAPGEARYGHCYLVITENNYYICVQNLDTDKWEWKLYAYNVYDYEQGGEMEDITTGATTVGSEYYSPYLDLIPRFDQVGYWLGKTEAQDFGLHLLFYYGKQPNKSGQLVPYASSGVYNSAGTQVGQWSLAFVCPKLDGKDVGLYELNWREFLETMQSNEGFELSLQLSRVEFLALKFHEVISVANIHMYIKKRKYTIPYNGTVQLECVRI